MKTQVQNAQEVSSKHAQEEWGAEKVKESHTTDPTWPCVPSKLWIRTWLSVHNSTLTSNTVLSHGNCSISSYLTTTNAGFMHSSTWWEEPWCICTYSMFLSFPFFYPTLPWNMLHGVDHTCISHLHNIGWKDMSSEVVCSDNALLLTRVVIRDGYPTMDMSVSVRDNFTWVLCVHGRTFDPVTLPTISTVWPTVLCSVAAVCSLLECLQSLAVCPGVPDKKFHCIAKLRKGIFLDQSGKWICTVYM